MIATAFPTTALTFQKLALCESTGEYIFMLNISRIKWYYHYLFYAKAL